VTARTTTRLLIVCVSLLLAVGFVMLASSSAVRAMADEGDPLYFVKRQACWLVLAIIAAWVVIRIDYHWYRKAVLPIGVVALALLVLVLIPGIGVEVNGSRRWLGVGLARIQPSEFAKIAMVIVLAAWMAHVERRASDMRAGWILPICGLGLMLVLIMREPDFGTTLLVGLVGLMLMFIGGTRWNYLAVTIALGVALFAIAIMDDPIRRTRILAFLSPEKYPETAYHLTQSIVAFIRGGFSGVGIGNSIQKQRYLPEPHTDFIYAIIAEERGFIFTALILVLFLAIMYCGVKICNLAPETFGRLMALGLTMIIVVQAAINIGVVTGCLPTKGIALPFISYGGSSLLASVVGMAMLANIGLNGIEEHDDPSRSVKDRNRRF
jgi:cell division protein FtsW